MSGKAIICSECGTPYCAECDKGALYECDNCGKTICEDCVHTDGDGDHLCSECYDDEYND